MPTCCKQNVIKKVNKKKLKTETNNSFQFLLHPNCKKIHTNRKIIVIPHTHFMSPSNATAVPRGMSSFMLIWFYAYDRAAETESVVTFNSRTNRIGHKMSQSAARFAQLYTTIRAPIRAAGCAATPAFRPTRVRRVDFADFIDGFRLVF